MRKCPFCGYDEGWTYANYDENKFLPDGQHQVKYSIVCKVCGGEGPGAQTIEMAEKKWDGLLAKIQDQKKFKEALNESSFMTMSLSELLTLKEEYNDFFNEYSTQDKNPSLNRNVFGKIQRISENSYLRIKEEYTKLIKAIKRKYKEHVMTNEENEEKNILKNLNENSFRHTYNLGPYWFSKFKKQYNDIYKFNFDKVDNIWTIYNDNGFHILTYFSDEGKVFTDIPYNKLSEEMGGVSAPMATLANVPGIGNVVPASTTSFGSGDNFGKPINKKPYTQGATLKKKKAMKKKKLVKESLY